MEGTDRSAQAVVYNLFNLRRPLLAGERQSVRRQLLGRIGTAFGPACRQIGMNCLADGQDASYFFAQPRPLDKGRIYAAVGTLATETDNATYVGLSVNDASLIKGALNVDDAKLKGSASSYHHDPARRRRRGPR